MTIVADLHAHTTCSDGILAPLDLVNKAVASGLTHLAITDHDTMEAHRQLRTIEIPEHITIIPGIEISCTEGAQEVHMLGYHLDMDDPTLIEYELSFKSERQERAQQIVTKLKKLNVSISYEDVTDVAGDASIGRPHIASVLVKRGYASSIQKAFDIYLDKGKPAYSARRTFRVSEAVDLIKKAGGVAVVAHPQRTFISEQRFLSLVADGIDGIEVFHPSHWPITVEHYRTMAERHQLLMTGGSDFHGSRDYDERNFGAVGATLDMVDALSIRAIQRQLHGR